MATVTPRIPPLPREEWTDAAREVFGYWEGDAARENGSRSHTMMTLANHPKLAMATLDLGKYFMLGATLTTRQVRMIVLRVAHRYGSTYQWTHNAFSARQIGMTDVEIEALKEGPESPVWNHEDRVLLMAIDQTCDGGKIEDGTWTELAAKMDRHQIMDLILAVGYYAMIAWGLIAMRVQIEPDFAAFSKNRGKAE